MALRSHPHAMCGARDSDSNRCVNDADDDGFTVYSPHPSLSDLVYAPPLPPLFSGVWSDRSWCCSAVLVQRCSLVRNFIQGGSLGYIQLASFWTLERGARLADATRQRIAWEAAYCISLNGCSGPHRLLHTCTYHCIIRPARYLSQMLSRFP
jgi:hypothetical protein